MRIGSASPGLGDRGASGARLDPPAVCMVVHAYYPLGEPRVQREARAAAEAGCEVTVLCLRGPGEPAHETIDGVRVERTAIAHERGAGIRRILFEYLAFCLVAFWWLTVRAFRGRFDIVHFHSPPDFLIFGGIVARLRGAELILDVHDLSSHMFRVRVSGRAGQVVSWLLVMVERLACRLASQVITVHEPYRQELIAHGVPAGKVHVVMNSVDGAVLERARSASPFGRRDHNAFRVAYHGTLTWWYGTDLILDAIAELRESGLVLDAVIVGDGDALPMLREKAQAAGLDGVVQLSGRYLPIEEALATVASAGCGVIPNRPTEINRFALSSKLFEYVALGIPVVVARLETLAAHFGPEEVTFFDPGDPSSLAAALRWVIEHPAEAQERAERAHVRAREYAWSRGRETLLSIYGTLVPAKAAALGPVGAASDPASRPAEHPVATGR